MPRPTRFLLPLLLLPLTGQAGDQAQFGQAWSRNMVSAETGLPSSFDPATGRNVLWKIPLGTETHGTPVVAGGRIYIGTNNGNPRDPRLKGDRGVLLCLDEKDGHLLWQLAVPKLTEDKYMDWPNMGHCSPVSVEGDRVYTVSNRGEVLCLDAKGMANGNDGPFKDEAALATIEGEKPVEPGDQAADIIWRSDLREVAKIWPHDSAHSSVLIDGDLIWLNTGNGVDNTHRLIRRPHAPSLVVLDKKTGRLIAQDAEEIGPKIFHCTWSAPSLATLGGKKQILFAGGDGVVYSFEPPEPGPEVKSLKLLWKYDPDPTGPKEFVHKYTQNKQEGPSNIYGMPVVKDGRLYIAAGGDIFWGKHKCWLKCVDPMAEGGPKEVWSQPLHGHVMTTASVADGLVTIADVGRNISCFDAATGAPLWTQDGHADFWGSPVTADGKVFLADRKGWVTILAAGREKKLLAEIDLRSPMSATPVMANGTVYFATMKELWAVREGAGQAKP